MSLLSTLSSSFDLSTSRTFHNILQTFFPSLKYKLENLNLLILTNNFDNNYKCIVAACIIHLYTTQSVKLNQLQWNRNTHLYNYNILIIRYNYVYVYIYYTIIINIIQVIIKDSEKHS